MQLAASTGQTFGLTPQACLAFKEQTALINCLPTHAFNRGTQRTPKEIQGSEYGRAVFGHRAKIQRLLEA